MDIFKKMNSGEPYDAAHPQLIGELERVREMIWEFDNLRPSQKEE